LLAFLLLKESPAAEGPRGAGKKKSLCAQLNENLKGKKRSSNQSGDGNDSWQFFAEGRVIDHLCKKRRDERYQCAGKRPVPLGLAFNPITKGNCSPSSRLSEKKKRVSAKLLINRMQKKTKGVGTGTS